MRTSALCFLCIAVSPFVCALPACSSSSSSTDPAATGDDQNQTGTDWEKLLTCENGQVVVDVDTGERRHLQIVVRDPSTFSVLDTTITYGEIKNSSERIYRGDSPFGVFGSGDLRHFRAYDVQGGAGGRPGIDVLIANGTVNLRQLDLSKPDCEPYSRDTSPPDDAYPDACQAASYVFKGCVTQ